MNPQPLAGSRWSWPKCRSCPPQTGPGERLWALLEKRSNAIGWVEIMQWSFTESFICLAVATRKRKKTQEVCPQSVLGPLLNGGLPLGGGGGGVGGLGSSGAAASAASPDVKPVLLSGLLQPDAFCLAPEMFVDPSAWITFQHLFLFHPVCCAIRESSRQALKEQVGLPSAGTFGSAAAAAAAASSAAGAVSAIIQC